MTVHVCDLCGNDGGFSDFWPFLICSNCGFCYVAQRRDSIEIAKAWDAVWTSGAYDSNWPAVKARLYYVAELCDQWFGWRGKSVLDIGAGQGTFAKFIQKRGAYPLALEPSQDNYALLRKIGIDARRGPIETATDIGKFDVVTILWTLENCGDCISMLQFAGQHMQPDGHLIVATGSRILVPFKKPLRSYLSNLDPDLHCFRFSNQTLAAAIQKVGLGVTHRNPYHECDWLVVAAGAHPNEPPMKPPYDNPQKVLDYFERWRREWP